MLTDDDYFVYDFHELKNKNVVCIFVGVSFGVIKREVKNRYGLSTSQKK